MAYIELDYILSNKTLEDNKTVEQIVLDYFSKIGFCYNQGGYLLSDGSRIECQFGHKTNSNRYYLSLYTDESASIINTRQAIKD